MTDTNARALAKRIVKDNGAARVRFGRTNGRVVLHVRDEKCKDRSRSSFTIAAPGEWDTCPLNSRMRRNDREAATQATEGLMAANGS